MEFGGKEDNQSVLWGPTVAVSFHATSHLCDLSAQVTVNINLISTESHLTQMGAAHGRTLKMTVPTDRCGTGVFLLRVRHLGQHHLCPKLLSHCWETCWWIYEIWNIFSVHVTSVNVWSSTEKVLAHSVSHLDQGMDTTFKYSHPQLCLPSSSYPSRPAAHHGTQAVQEYTFILMTTTDNIKINKLQ